MRSPTREILVVAGVVIAWRESELAGFKFRARYNVDNGKPPRRSLAAGCLDYIMLLLLLLAG